MFSKQRSDSIVSFFGRKENFVWSMIGVGGVFWLCIKLFTSSICIEFWDLSNLGYFLQILYMGVVLECAVRGGSC